MILVNRNFGNPVLAEVIGDMFRGSSDAGQNVSFLFNRGTLASGSSLVSEYSRRAGMYEPDLNDSDMIDSNAYTNAYNNYQTTCNNFYLVTEHFLKTLDKVYTKIWNESFTETGIYVPVYLATLYSGFVTNTSGGATGPFMMFKKFVDRCITAGILVESDRLDYQDQIFISGMSRANMSTQVDLANKLITMTHSSPIDIAPDINTMPGQYLAGKKLYLMMTPYLTNETVIKGSASDVKQEPFISSFYTSFINDKYITYYPTPDRPVKQPLAFFKPKTDASKFGRSLPLATHLIWSIGTPEDKALAEANNQTPPDLIFDHLDRISHIDSLVLKIKFDKLQF